jgi:hypothetical protein
LLRHQAQDGGPASSCKARGLDGPPVSSVRSDRYCAETATGPSGVAAIVASLEWAGSCGRRPWTNCHNSGTSFAAT